MMTQLLNNFIDRAKRAIVRFGSADVTFTRAEQAALVSCQRCGGQVNLSKMVTAPVERSGLCHYCGGSIFLDFVFYFVEVEDDPTCVSVAPTTKLLIEHEDVR